MAKKLTILGVLAALAFGALNLFQGSASAEIQTFAPGTGVGEFVDTKTCYFGDYPTSAAPITCAANSSDTNIDSTLHPVGSAVTLYSVSRLDAGARLTLPITSTDPDFYGPKPALTSLTGDVTAATDLLCSGGAPDILANPVADGYPGTPTVPGGGAWPGTNWNGFDFHRIANVVGDLGPADAYVDIIRPQPATFPFYSSDLATLTHLYLAGAALFPLPTPTKLNLASYTSAYGGGFQTSVALLGGEPSNPPTDDYICLDSPQHSVGTTLPGALIVPANGDYIRWTQFTSAADVVDGTVARILDAQCVKVSAGGVGAPACDMTDADGDLIPAAVETATGSLPGDATTDSDLAGDYEELFNFTNAAVADTDGDLSLDKFDDGSDEGTGSDVLADDTTADDNCPADANGSQLNTDYLSPAVQPPAPGIPKIDETNPNQDALGDACDTDDDNDGLTDVAEGVMTIVPWSGNTDPGGVDLPDTTVCKGPGVGVAPVVVMSTTDPDSDDDGYLDGRECQMSARPDLADGDQADPSVNGDSLGSCNTVPVDTDGCARIERTGITDPDADKLYHPTSASGHAAVEGFYRTRQINTNSATQVHDTDGDTLAGDADPDSDNDGIFDGPEVWSYGTAPSNVDTDGDACTDGKEAADLDGNRTVGAADSGTASAVYPAGYGPNSATIRAANGTITALHYKKFVDFNRNFSAPSAQDSGLRAVQQLIGGGACNNPIIVGPSYNGAAGTSQKGRIIVNQ